MLTAAALAAFLAATAACALALSVLARLRELHHDVERVPAHIRDDGDRLRAVLAAELGRSRSEGADRDHRSQEVLHLSLEQTRRTLDERLDVLTRQVSDDLARLRADNEAKLESMRATVQEKLDATLGERFDASFRVVSERLESVQQGLGEMQVLAQGVGSLQRTLTNVKTRGIWGELQLEAVLSDLLTPEQYERQCRVVPGAGELADFAVRMPGGEHGHPVRLALDAKFPMDVYERFVCAWETGEREAIATAAKALEERVRSEAQSVGSKYVSPPHTTDFAVLYLPTEGLFAEVARTPGLLHDLRTQHRVIVAGPTTLTALLGSLSMGFRTLAIQERSSEVWQVLAQVKGEFDKSEAVWVRMARQLETARRTAEEAGSRHRAVGRSLRAVETRAVGPDVPFACDESLATGDHAPEVTTV